MCLKFPDENFCLITTCKPGFQMTNILGVTYGYRNRNARPVYVLCRNGTWVTNHEERHFGIKDICLPEGTAIYLIHVLLVYIYFGCHDIHVPWVKIIKKIFCKVTILYTFLFGLNYIY